MLYVIKKNGLFTKDFTHGAELTKSRNKAEYFTDKKKAAIVAREYGRLYGPGFSVVETLLAPSWM